MPGRKIVVESDISRAGVVSCPKLNSRRKRVGPGSLHYSREDEQNEEQIYVLMFLSEGFAFK